MKNSHDLITLEAVDAVILYDTVPAGRRGMSMLARLTGMAEDDLFEIRPRPWRLDFMHDTTTSEDATHDISRAHVIIVSTSGEIQLPSAFKIWLSTLLDHKRGEHIAVITLLGMDEDSVRGTSGDFDFIKQHTLDAGFDFFAPWQDGEDELEIDLDQKPAQETTLER